MRKDLVIAMVVFWIGIGDIAAAAAQPGGASQFIRQFGGQAIAALRVPDTSLEAREAQIRNEDLLDDAEETGPPDEFYELEDDLYELEEDHEGETPP